MVGGLNTEGDANADAVEDISGHFLFESVLPDVQVTASWAFGDPGRKLGLWGGGIALAWG